MRNILLGSIALITTRQTRDPFGVLAANTLIGHKSVAAYDINSVYPLYIYSAAGEVSDQHELTLHEKLRPNLNPTFLTALAKKLKLHQEGPHSLPKSISPEDIFNYTYAVFHSPTYRTRYAEFLKTDYPRLPITSNLNLFRRIAAKGAELVALHIMQSPKLGHFLTNFLIKGDNIVEKILYSEKDMRVWINASQYFGGMPKDVWQFQIGGYQVCDKWLKDRKGCRLSYDDTQHYQKIVVAISETTRIMAEIDALIPKWPLV